MSTVWSSPIEAVIAPEKPKTLTAGDVGVLRIDGGGDVLVAVTEQDLDRFTKLAVAEDEYGLGEMILSGRVFPVTDGTKCKIIDAGFLVHEIRIMEGPATGKP